jgi:predicted small lipoprotein YifL
VLAVLCALVTLAGCGTGAVEVPPPSPDASVTRLCDGLRGRLPDTLGGQSRRETRPESGLTAAWGTPAIALRCGVPRPPSMRQTSGLVTVNGISWFPLPPDRPVTFTALGRQAYVEMTVPAKYAPPGDVLVELTGAIKAALPAKTGGEL